MEQNEKMSNRKWLVFVIVCLAYMPGSYAQYQLSVFAPELMQSFGLTTSQFSSLFTAPMIIAIFLSFVGGMISDRVGSKRVVNIAFLVAIAGMLGRIFANSYTPFFLCMALTGFSNMFVNINASKITGSWFEPGKIGLLMGIFAFCGQLPGAFATATTAFLFDNRTSAFIASAIFGIAVFVLWLFFVKDRPDNVVAVQLSMEQEEQPSIGEALKVVLSNKGVWLISICIMMVLGSTVTLSTFMPTALQDMYGINLEVSGTIASMLTLGNCIGAIVGPIVFAKIKNIKIFVPGTALLSFLGILICWRFPSVMLLHMLVLFTGTMLGAAMPIFFSAPILLEGIGTKYAGSASGVIATLQLLGAVLIPTYILTPIAGNDYGFLFTLASGCMILMFICGLLIPQFGDNKKS